MNPILELAEWYTKSSIQCDTYIRELGDDEPTVTAEYVAHRDRYRATAALLRELVDKRAVCDENESNDELRSLKFSNESIEEESDKRLKEIP